MMTKVSNPTRKTKAVRVKGGHVTIKPGKSETIKDLDLSESETQRYEAAGLKFASATKAKSD
ncbi:MAG: hypothetical protein AAFU56_07680 [Pseudomonadota bacterium]